MRKKRESFSLRVPNKKGEAEPRPHDDPSKATGRRSPSLVPNRALGLHSIKMGSLIYCRYFYILTISNTLATNSHAWSLFRTSTEQALTVTSAQWSPFSSCLANFVTKSSASSSPIMRMHPKTYQIPLVGLSLTIFVFDIVGFVTMSCRCTSRARFSFAKFVAKTLFSADLSMIQSLALSIWSIRQIQVISKISTTK